MLSYTLEEGVKDSFYAKGRAYADRSGMGFEQAFKAIAPALKSATKLGIEKNVLREAFKMGYEKK